MFSADYRMAKMLLSHGAQANLPDVSGNTPLHTATIYGHMELVKLLLQHGADVYKKGQYGAIPVHMAAREGHASLVRLFCQFSEVNNWKHDDLFVDIESWSIVSSYRH